MARTEESQLIVWVQKEMHKELKLAALKQDTTIKEVLTNLVEKYLKDYKENNK